MNFVTLEILSEIIEKFKKEGTYEAVKTIPLEYIENFASAPDKCLSLYSDVGSVAIGFLQE